MTVKWSKALVVKCLNEDKLPSELEEKKPELDSRSVLGKVKEAVNKMRLPQGM
jgi:hypothetical protein